MDLVAGASLIPGWRLFQSSWKCDVLTRTARVVQRYVMWQGHHHHDDLKDNQEQQEEQEEEEKSFCGSETVQIRTMDEAQYSSGASVCRDFLRQVLGPFQEDTRSMVKKQKGFYMLENIRNSDELVLLLVLDRAPPASLMCPAPGDPLVNHFPQLLALARAPKIAGEVSWSCIPETPYSEFFDVSHSLRGLIDDAEIAARKAAIVAKRVLCMHKVNVVTVESLTSGLIAATLTDVPGMGIVLYGGFIVYDTDTKRKWVGVTTPGVYSRETAEQMAAGALRNSRAMVALAVTGNSMARPGHLALEGIVDIGVALRTSPSFTTISKRIALCTVEPIKPVCDEWKKKFGPNSFPPWSLTQALSRALRLHVVNEALTFLVETLEQAAPIWAKIPAEDYDGLYLGCGEPTAIINMNHVHGVWPTVDDGPCPEGFVVRRQIPK